MRFNDHSELTGKHAFLSPSSYHWLNYDEQKLEARYYSFSASARGTHLHTLAHEAIRLDILLDERHEALAAYVADAIELGMACEQPLYYSPNCFGTPDTIKYDGAVLRIHDLKTGITKASMRQLEVYAAIFCLEYEIDPESITFDLRIYQRSDVLIDNPEPWVIGEVMAKIEESDRFINELEKEER